MEGRRGGAGCQPDSRYGQWIIDVFLRDAFPEEIKSRASFPEVVEELVPEQE
jgi:hypothetical protein